MWLVFSLIAPIFFALVHVIDSHCVKEIFNKPWMGMITSAFASIVIFAILPFVLPFITWQWPDLQTIALALIAGALIQISQGFYFEALSYSEAGIVAAYWNIVPALVPFFSFVFLHETLHLIQYFGIILIIFSAVLFNLIDSNLEARLRSLYLMFIASILQVAMLIIQKIVFEKAHYFEGFMIMTTGLIIAGVLPLLSKYVRKEIQNNSTQLILSAKFFILIEIANLIALACSQRAIDLGFPPLVAAVESTIPAYTFALIILLNIFNPKFGDPIASKRITSKIMLIIVMASGVGLLA